MRTEVPGVTVGEVEEFSQASGPVWQRMSRAWLAKQVSQPMSARPPTQRRLGAL